jgi:hypothetical protein
MKAFTHPRVAVFRCHSRTICPSSLLLSEKSCREVRLHENDFLHSELNSERRPGMYDFTTHVRDELMILTIFFLRYYNSDTFIDVRSNLDERKQLLWNAALHFVK